jgi:hypothetical protein
VSEPIPERAVVKLTPTQTARRANRQGLTENDQEAVAATVDVKKAEGRRWWVRSLLGTVVAVPLLGAAIAAVAVWVDGGGGGWVPIFAFFGAVVGAGIGFLLLLLRAGSRRIESL